MSVEGGVLRIVARTPESVPASCPDCGTPSVRRHSGYQRRLADGAIGGRQVSIALSVRRLFCDAPECDRVTFAEQIEWLTMRYGRRTPQLGNLLSAISVALAGRAGERLAARLPMTVSRTTLLGLAMALPDPPAGTPRVLGVDEFATRKGHNYGTVLVDCETHAPIDLLPDREAATFAAWLTEHPGVEIICRDRGGAFADGARSGAPDAVQVADLWHLWHNLAEAVKVLVSKHSSCLREPAPSLEAPPEVLHPPDSHAGRLAERARRHHTAVHDLLGQGLTVRAVARRLELSRNTVRRYARAVTWEELATGRWQNLPSTLDPYKPYLHQRWHEGHTNGAQLHAELQERGFTGSYSVVRDYLRRFRRTPADRPPPARPPGVRKVTGWITRNPDRMNDDDQQKLKDILARCPELEAATGHVRSFAAMMAIRSATRLPEWIATARANADHGLRGFADGLLADLDAVVLGLSTEGSSGCVEGRVTDIKLLKRQMAGRAGLPLLRKRVLLVAADRQQHRVTNQTTH
ncbi:ISL3 family transposase [Streptomyces sp. NBC_00271]|uniref:ISL3 family transposase n=1 Tax=Streptomyces sp. NBC_00271 TaxID=2975697 RepID=UPI002E299212|nr:ISL3 family transposase [Streptomyces sp. NBC_00271]